MSLGHATKGFTLVELLAVLVLAAMIMSVAAVSVGSSLLGAEIRNAHREVLGGLRLSRTQAIVTGEPAFFEVEVEERRWKAAGRDWRTLPGDMEIRLLTVASELTGNHGGRVRFFPDGSSSGGRVTLSRGDRQWCIGIAWLTGEIALEDCDAPRRR